MADTTISLHFDSPAAAPAPGGEAALVEGLRRGVDSAYETLILRFEQPVFGLVSRLMEDPGDAADVVQEVFLKVFRNIGHFRGDSTLRTWIYRIAVNEARNHLRWFSRHRRQEVGLEDETNHCQEWLPDPGRSPLEVTLDHETRTLIEEALARMNPAFRAALVLREIEGLSYEEIAEILDISLGTVKSRILRGRDALRKHLAGQLRPAAAANLGRGAAAGLGRSPAGEGGASPVINLSPQLVD